MISANIFLPLTESNGDNRPDEFNRWILDHSIISFSLAFGKSLTTGGKSNTWNERKKKRIVTVIIVR